MEDKQAEYQGEDPRTMADGDTAAEIAAVAAQEIEEEVAE